MGIIGQNQGQAMATGLTETYTSRLRRQKAELEERLKLTTEVLQRLEKSPDLQGILDAIVKLGGIY